MNAKDLHDRMKEVMVDPMGGLLSMNDETWAAFLRTHNEMLALYGRELDRKYEAAMKVFYTPALQEIAQSKLILEICKMNLDSFVSIRKDHKARTTGVALN